MPSKYSGADCRYKAAAGVGLLMVLLIWLLVLTGYRAWKTLCAAGQLYTKSVASARCRILLKGQEISKANLLETHLRKKQTKY